MNSIIKLSSRLGTLVVMLTVILVSAAPAFAGSTDGVSTVPEPLSFTLLGLGLVGLVGKKVMDRRRGK